MPLPRIVTLPVAAMPVWVVERTSRLALDMILARHPTLFDRLGEYASRRYLFTPTDLPLAFTIVPADKSIRVQRPGPDAKGDAAISGPIVTLLALAEGRVDGDALFFSRDIVITGDTAAVVTLRNLLERDAVDVFATATGLFGPFDGLVRRAAGALDRRLVAARGHLAAVHSGLHRDLHDDRALAMRTEMLDADMRALSARVARLEARSRRHSPPSESTVDMT